MPPSETETFSWKSSRAQTSSSLRVPSSCSDRTSGFGRDRRQQSVPRAAAGSRQCGHGERRSESSANTAAPGSLGAVPAAGEPTPPPVAEQEETSPGKGAAVPSFQEEGKGAFPRLPGRAAA